MKEKSRNVFNSSYNKAVYSGVVGAGVDFLFGLLAEFGIEVSTSLQTNTLILAMALTAFLVKNRSAYEKPAAG